MNNWKILLLGVITFFIAGCNSNEEGNSEESNSTLVLGKEGIYTLDKLRWIEGSWLDSTTFSFRTPPASFMEKWVNYPDSISGKGISIKEGDTTIMEALCIREVNGKINYIARPAGEAVIGFPLTYLDENEAVFENPAHDFPQKIKYLKRTKDSLIIEISGIIPQGQRTVTFKMRSSSF